MVSTTSIVLMAVSGLLFFSIFFKGCLSESRHFTVKTPTNTMVMVMLAGGGVFTVVAVASFLRATDEAERTDRRDARATLTSITQAQERIHRRHGAYAMTKLDLQHLAPRAYAKLQKRKVDYRIAGGPTSGVVRITVRATRDDTVSKTLIPR